MVHRWGLAALLALAGCRSVTTVPVTGAWVGHEGPNPAKLEAGARVELLEDAGVILGVWYSADPLTGTLGPISIWTGIRDGGVLELRNAGEFKPDGGFGPGEPFPARLTSPDHLDMVLMMTRVDGGQLPIYLKLDRSKETPAIQWPGP
jgi:hypothetical protein